MNKGIKQNIKACGYTHSVEGKSWRQRTVKKSEGVNRNGSTNIFLNYRVPLLDLPCPLSSLVICVCVSDTDIHLIRMRLIIILCMGRIADGSLVAMCSLLFFFFTSESQLVAGHTSDFVHSVLKATAQDNPSFGDLEQLSVCF